MLPLCCFYRGVSHPEDREQPTSIHTHMHISMRIQKRLKRGFLLSGEIFLFLLLCFPAASFPTGEYYTVQAGILSKVENAEELFCLLKRKLSKRGLYYLRIGKEKRYYKVRLGKFDSREKAAQLLEMVKPIVPGAFISKCSGDEDITKIYTHAKASEYYKTEPLRELLRKISRSVDTKDYGRAQNLIQDGMKKWPSSHELNGWYGSVLLKQNGYGSALLYFKQAISLSPKIPDYHNGAGYSLLYMNETQKACASFEKALELNPKFADSLAGLGFAYMDLGNKEDALRVYHRLKTCDHETAHALLNRITRQR